MSKARQIRPESIIALLTRKVQWLEGLALTLEDDLANERERNRQLTAELNAVKGDKQ